MKLVSKKKEMILSSLANFHDVKGIKVTVQLS